MELKREAIVKALECWSTPELCKGDECVLFDMGKSCARIMAKNALSLINELTEENERLRGCVKSKEEVEAIMRATYEPLVKEIVKEQIDKGGNNANKED